MPGSIGRTLIVLGAVLVIAGILVTFSDRLPFRIGRLPGDIEIRGKNSVFYFPLMTSILLSIVLSVVLWLFSRR
jgi:hypothetical protein